VIEFAEPLNCIDPIGRLIGPKPRESIFEQHKKHLRERLWVGINGFHIASWLVRRGWHGSMLGFFTP